MLTLGRQRTLLRILAGRVVLVSVAVSLALLAFFLTKYMVDKAALRRATLEANLQAIMSDITQGKDPARWPEFRNYPEAYGFRVFDHRTSDRRKLVAEANPALLPPIEEPHLDTDTGERINLTEGFGLLEGDASKREGDHWLLTDHQDLNGHSYWAQVVMVGDPAWLWTGVIGNEMLDHVAVPVLFIVPALAGAILLTTLHALRPLTRIARQAGTLGAAVSSGGALAPLPQDHLPSEVGNVVAAINAMLRKLERSLQSQKQFASDAAHELRTPLAVLLMEVAELPPSPVRDRLTEELNSVSGLVNQLLRFAQAEDVMAAERRTLDLVGVARQVCLDMAAVALARRQVLEFDAPESAVPVLGHDVLIDAALRNIVDNAMKHSPEKAIIAVAVHPDGKITVDDPGPGIPDAHKEMVFNRFWRAEHSRGGGSGIGLALVRRIAQLHGGNVWVEDRPGGGARFVLRLTGGAPA